MDEDGYVLYWIEMSNYKINMLGNGNIKIFSKIEIFHDYIKKQSRNSSYVNGIINVESIDLPADSPNVWMTFNTKYNVIIHVKYSCNCGILI